jgi:2-oxoglutarate dehydrogenase E2 component (dihydrolipoamide succinyltransferase)
MAIELKIPEVGESITEVEIGGWLKPQGEEVKKDEPVVTLESEKATVELPAPESGTLSQVLKQNGETAKVGEVIGYIEPSGGKPKAEKATPAVAKPGASEPPAKEPGAKKESVAQPKTDKVAQKKEQQVQSREEITRNRTKDHETPKTGLAAPTAGRHGSFQAGDSGREEEFVPMTPLRRTVAERLVKAQREAALLTTFNEIDMGEVIGLRKQYGEAFQEKYKVKLGFMSFFVKASIEGLKEFSAINAEVRESNIVYRNYFDIGIAVGSGKGLVVPVLRDAQLMSFSEIEMAIRDFGARARENKLKIEELQGGTFTISNGGVYGSLLSTPIVNPPQSGVLGLHAIQERPVAREGNVIIRPMMYVALTYDHRIVDGREAVSFLKRVKEIIEAPARMVMEV